MVAKMAQEDGLTWSAGDSRRGIASEFFTPSGRVLLVNDREQHPCDLVLALLYDTLL